MVSKKAFMTDTVRPIALALVFATFGSLTVLVLNAFFDLKITKLQASLITFAVAAFAAFYLFPGVLRSPFRDLRWPAFMRRLGFYLPSNAWKHVLLGILLALCTLSGILLGSLLSGRYEPDWSTVNATQILFSINPGVWEEFFFRGVIMFVLLAATRSLKKAASIQILLFGLAHIKGVDAWAWVDVLSVMILAVAFTYAAHKTRTLVTGIVFHFLHDAFLFLPQLPGGEYIGMAENIAFYASLWLMVGVGCLLIKFCADKLGVRAEERLYSFEHLPA